MNQDLMATETKKEIESLLKKMNMSIGFGISFPRYKIIPEEVDLAMKIVKKHGMKITFLIQSEKKAAEKK